ncbi:GNAT family N-acetyltransferase [Shinella sp. CPCC 101442]|uniref:GNAT family N-acetyltransferase n=1 Tax=Shinella sp. CPCC 101442 TaxID=2932265 RepID=UPI002152AD88|nr:GNAT family N-acetyltransferase [Shinella sp. CPCC 101442]MCR6501524.1 GNAT family N-acetyltransferase [Shinella sp. CPCC 101442]
MNAMQTPVERPRVSGPGPCPTVTTARLTLRPHRMSDADAIAQSLADFQVSRMLARVPAPYDRQDATEWLSLMTTDLNEGWAFAITAGDDVHIGCVSFERRGGEWELGYWLNRFYWRRGYMSEAVHAATARFLMRMPGTAIRSGVFADNAPSLRVQEKAGFRITGCSDVFSVARGAMVPHIETLLEPGDFRPASPRR